MAEGSAAESAAAGGGAAGSRQAASDRCAILRCGSQSAGVGPHCRLPLCKRHLRTEDTKQEELRALRQHRAALDDIERRIDAEMQESDDGFERLLEEVACWRRVVKEELQSRRQRVIAAMEDFIAVDIYQQQLQEVAATSDTSAIFTILGSMEKTVDLLKADFDFRKTANGYESSVETMNAEAAFGDVGGRVKDLQFVVQQRLARMIGATRLNDAGSMPVTSVSDACTPYRTVGNLGGSPNRTVGSLDLGGSPAFVVVCTNTCGFVVDDETQTVAKAKTRSEDTRNPLPQCCLFVRILSHNFLLVATPDDEVRLQCCCDVNWENAFSGLHCDSRRQQLFILQLNCVTVTDLSGAAVRSVTAQQLNEPVGELRGVCGNDDKLFLYDDKEKKVLVICKETDAVAQVLRSDVMVTNGHWNAMALTGQKLLLPQCSSKQLHKVCCISGKVLQSYPGFGHPHAVAVGNNGVMFVSDEANHVVYVLLQDGSHVQTLGAKGAAGSGDGQCNGPCGLAVISNYNGKELLVIADYNNSRLVLYSLL